MEKLLSIHEGDSIGSFLSLQIAHKDDFLNFNENEILFREGRDWKDIEITDETGVIGFSEKDTENGMLLTYQGSFAIHGLIQSISKIIRPYLGRKSVLRLTSFNKEVFILGDPDNPVSISSNASTGTRVIDRSEIVYSFAVEIPLIDEVS